MEYLPTAAQMKAADAFTIQKLHVPSLTLMERAAKSCVTVLKQSGWSMARICIVCGSGNNGGDGFAIGRLLIEEGYCVTAVMAGNRSHCTAECLTQIELFEKARGVLCNEYVPAEYSIIIDALFGVGLSRDITGSYRALIEKMNQSSAKRFAVDIPSGISADTGNVMGAAFRADKTVTFQKKKFGMEIYPGREYCGEVITADIGISSAVLEEDKSVPIQLSEEDYRRLFPARKADSNKGTYGKVLVIAGSRGMSGAAYFNAKSAYLTGAGLVRIYTAEENRCILQQLLPEAIVTAYGEEREDFTGLLDWADVVCIGSGIGTGDAAEWILETTVKHCKKPCVIDADGLNLLAKHREYFEYMKGKKEETSGKDSLGSWIFTPHMKEMSRLTGSAVEEIKGDRLKALCEFTAEKNRILVLKDAKTVVGTYGEHPAVNSSGNSCMAKAGSGDVLTGIITGFLAQGCSSWEAALLGAYIHGRAGDFAREEKGAYSVMAEDLMRHTATAIKKLTNTETNTERGSVV